MVLLAIAIAVNGCGGSSPSGGGTGGAGGATGGAGTTGGAGVGGQGGGAAGTAGAGAGGGTAGAGGAPACGADTGPSSGATCNVVVAGGPCVTGTFSTAAAPTPAGGAFVAGTYDLVSQTFYYPADAGIVLLPGQPIRQTYVLSDVTSTSFTLDQVETSGTIVARSHETVAVSGMTATFTQTCPPPDGGFDWSGSSEFTAASSAITLFRSAFPGVFEVTVYNRAGTSIGAALAQATPSATIR